MPQVVQLIVLRKGDRELRITITRVSSGGVTINGTPYPSVPR